MTLRWAFGLLLTAIMVAWLVAETWARRRRHRVVPPAPPNPVQPPLDFPHVAPAILHLIDRATERPICGASIREAWTIIPETATCPECRKQGDAAMLQWEVNNR